MFYTSLTRCLFLLLLFLSSACLEVQDSPTQLKTPQASAQLSAESSSVKAFKPFVPSESKPIPQLKASKEVREAVARKAIAEGEWLRLSEHVKVQVLQGRILGTMFLTNGLSEKQQERYRDLMGVRYVEGDLHATDITPLLWRSLKLELTQEDGSVALLSMLRPLWWIEITGAKEGGTVWLESEEAGLSGQAKILSLRDDVTIDSRKLGPNAAPVIGTIKHQNAHIIELMINGDQDQKLGVTPSHPLYSADREDWVPAGEFRIGERIKTEGGSVAKVTAILDEGRRETVYNLEIHRAESYYVGEQRMLAHNTGLDDCGLTVGTQSEMVGETFKKLMGMKGKATGKEMSDAFDNMTNQVTKAHPNWRADRSSGADGSSIFQGERIDNTLVISGDGRIFRADASPSSGHFDYGPNGMKPNYDAMRELK